MANDFKKHGKAVIEKVRAEGPADYMKVAAALLPRQQEIEVGPPSEVKASDLTDDQLATLIAQHLEPAPQPVAALPNPRVKAGCYGYPSRYGFPNQVRSRPIFFWRL
jgi:hypothetical protein